MKTPAFWPPEAGDVWNDRNGAKWFGAYCDAGSEKTVLVALWAEARDPARVLAELGPMVLVFRDEAGL